MELVQHSPEANIAAVVHLLLLFSFHLAGNAVLVIWCSLLQITSTHFFLETQTKYTDRYNNL